MRKVLIIGATSAIAEATARIFAARGDALFLVARNASRLQVIATDLALRGATHIGIAQFDATNFDSHPALIDQVEHELDGIDTVLIAHGSLSDQTLCEKSIADLRSEFDVNAMSTLALLTILANKFETQKAGTLAVISSVAGDRGRQSNYVYGSAKAAVTTFMSGLRQRLAKSNVHVLTIKPGFVDTPMTVAIPNKGVLWAQPDKIAQGIVRAIDTHRNVVYLPWFWRPIMLAIRHVPEFEFKNMKL